jgi:hypothetical protein
LCVSHQIVTDDYLIQELGLSPSFISHSFSTVDFS